MLRKKPKNNYDRLPKSIAGVTLIEMMIAVLILSIGLLGIAGLQAATTKYKINTWARASISTLFGDLAERVRVNAGTAGNPFTNSGDAVTSQYIVSATWAAQQSASLTLTKDCESVACNPGERATFDIENWRQRVRQELPQGAAMVSGSRRDGINVALMWFDKGLVDDTDADRPLKKSDICANEDTKADPVLQAGENAAKYQNCCPKLAEAPEGVRCSRFSFVP